jgi:hypothetical protein
VRFSSLISTICRAYRPDLFLSGSTILKGGWMSHELVLDIVTEIKMFTCGRNHIHITSLWRVA